MLHLPFLTEIYAEIKPDLDPVLKDIEQLERENGSRFSFTEEPTPERLSHLRPWKYTPRAVLTRSPSNAESSRIIRMLKARYPEGEGIGHLKIVGISIRLPLSHEEKQNPEFLGPHFDFPFRESN